MALLCHQLAKRPWARQSSLVSSLLTHKIRELETGFLSAITVQNSNSYSKEPKRENIEIIKK